MISVIIPTYNRYKDLQKAIQSVYDQTYRDIEVIIVDDASTDPRYHQEDALECNSIIHLEQNSKSVFGFPCAGRARNEGARVAEGEWLAFLDDDDTWVDHKLQKQITALQGSGCKMSCTEGYILPFDKRYNQEYYWGYLQQVYHGTGFIKNGIFPCRWTHSFLQIHNCVITSSVVMEKDLLWQLDGFLHAPNGVEDYDLWKRATKETDCYYIHEPCFYYNFRWI